MAIKKYAKNRPEESFWKPIINDDLMNRIRIIAEQTRIPPSKLFLKWVLQEETFIGLIQGGKGQTIKQPKTAADIPVQKSVPAQRESKKDARNQVYRKELVKKAEKLKKKGMTHKKIAETFNDEKVPTVSGTGKWYSSSINILLNAKK
jgi:hypothetical protein